MTLRTITANEEASQALARLFIAATVMVVMGILFLRSVGWRPALPPADILAMFAYFLISLPWFIWVNRTPGRFENRRYVTLATDFFMMTVCMNIAGDRGAFFYPLYLWIIVGNGLRFGIRFLVAATVGGVLSFGAVLLVSPFWQAQREIGTGLLAGLAVLPLFYISVLRRAHELNARLDRELERSLTAEKAKGDFLANMSHEIRTPMNGIIGVAEILAETRLETRQREYVDIIRRSSSSLLKIINDILDFSKLGSGKMALESVDLDPVTTLQDVIQLMGPTARERGVDLEFTCHPDLPSTLRGDPTRIRQIAFNLVGNGIKFTSAGSVRLACRPGGDGPGHLVMTVTDTGIGIPADRLESVFEEFEQAEQDTARRYGGTGLGLAICRRLARLMGGDVTVESVPGRGTTFTVDLQLEPGTAILPASDRAGPDRDYGLTALVAEDNAVNQLVALNALARVGIRADVAHNGREALVRLAGGGYDLVLMDVRMPVMDGLTATAAIREQQGAAGEIPIIGLTADASAEATRRCLEAGMDACLLKPMNREKLCAAIDEVLAASPVLT